MNLFALKIKTQFIYLSFCKIRSYPAQSRIFNISIVLQFELVVFVPNDSIQISPLFVLSLLDFHSEPDHVMEGQNVELNIKSFSYTVGHPNLHSLVDEVVVVNTLHLWKLSTK